MSGVMVLPTMVENRPAADACLVTKKYQVFSPAVKVFLDAVKKRLSTAM